MILLAVIAACVLEKSDTWGPDGKVPLRAETVVSGLEVPWSFAFLPGGDVLVSERPGRVRLLQHGKLVAPPVLTVKTAETSEGGVLGIAVNPRDESQLFLYLTDHGPSGEMGRYAHDEVNVARKGDNLGWPDIYGCEQKAGTLPPVITWATHALPPGGAVVYRGTAIPELRGNVLIASLGAEHIHRIVLENGNVAAHE